MFDTIQMERQFVTAMQESYDAARILAIRRELTTVMDDERRDELTAELAELTIDELPNVTEEEDARLSRPFPY